MQVKPEFMQPNGTEQTCDNVYIIMFLYDVIMIYKMVTSKEKQI